MATSHPRCVDRGGHDPLRHRIEVTSPKARVVYDYVLGLGLANTTSTRHHRRVTPREFAMSAGDAGPSIAEATSRDAPNAQSMAFRNRQQ